MTSVVTTELNAPEFLIERRNIAPRPLLSIEGIGDRLRAAAFAEVQAEAAFRWAAQRMTDAHAELKQQWLILADEEVKHRGWLTTRARELKIELKDRPVSDRLWDCLLRCQSAHEFSTVMARAEDSGRVAGERFARGLAEFDAITAEIFGQIAYEERTHIELALRFYPDIKAEIPSQRSC